MQASNIIQPTVLSTPVAVDGLKNTIPTNPTSSSSNLASITGGFPSITMQSVANGGLPPMGQDFNGLFYVATDQKVYLQNGGIITFNEDVSTAIGGYPNGAILDYLDSNNNFLKVQSLIDNNTYNFITTPSYIDGEHWQILNNGGANIDLSNLSDTGNDYINQSKALETGNISSNPDVYVDILKRTHSSFDLSKFEVVGSPTISEDGIVTNITSGVNITSLEAFHQASNFTIISPAIIVNSIIDNRSVVFCSWGTSMYVSFSEQRYAWILFFVNKDGTRTVEQHAIPNLTLEFNKKYVYKIEQLYKNSKYIRTLKVYNSEDLLNSLGEYSYESIYPIYWQNGTNKIKLLYQDNYTVDANFDLKNIAVWADGIPVFNGNKTGLEIIKPDNYEIVGSPTITEDGIASGFSASNYIKIDKLVEAPKTSLNIPIAFVPVKNTTNDRYQCLFAICTDDINKRIYLYVANDGTSVSLNINSTIVATGTVNINNINFAEVLWEKMDETQCKFSLYVNNKFIASKTFNTADIVFTNDFNIGYLGLTSGSVNYGSIDLNSIKQIIDGNLVYQPCLKIPYTEAFKHSRIVDVAYRHRVQDLAEQKGEALFYTIDEQNQNFTLPSADIYGMITKNRKIAEHADLATAKAYIVETYKNGASWYRIWSDGWIEQGGITSQTNTTINFLKSFSNTNYIFTATKRNPTTGSWGPEKGPIGTSGAKVSSIITASYTDNYPLSWRACGY